MSSITSAGVPSGIDFESIIEASVTAKSTSLSSRVTEQKTNAEIELTGVGKLKSLLSSFQDICTDIAEKNSFNKRSITVHQDATDPVFTVEGKDDASNGNYNITVTQLAQSTSYATTVADSTEQLGAGTLTFSVGSGDDAKSFTVDVAEDDTLESLRTKINQHTESFGVTANILTLSDGSSKFILDSTLTGDDYSNFSITSTGSANLEQFTAGVTTDASGNKVSSGNMDLVKVGQDALIDVDGSVLSSNTNTFDDTIKGLKITVNRLSDTETITDSDGTTTTGYKSNKVSISTDTTAIKDMLQSFIDTYNTLRSSLDELSARNTYTDGESNDDGGYLAGDSTCDSIKSSLSNMLSSFKLEGEGVNNIFSMGIEMDNYGNLSINTDTFNEIVDSNYEQLVAAFGGDNGICSQMDKYLEEYTKSSGVLDLREQSLNSEIKTWEDKESANAFYLEKYEQSLRAKYASLDTYIANMNTSLSYLYSAFSSSSSS